MKKIVKRVLAGIGVLVVLAVAAVVVKFYVLSPKSRAAQAMKAPTTPEAIARGKYIAHHVAACVGCHSNVQEDKPGEPYIPAMLGAGRDFGDWGADVPFRIRVPNITPEKDTGIGNWSDGEVVRAMREGVSRDGRPLHPQMPYATYARTLSDDDALAVVAYLRTLAPVKNDPGKTEIKFPVSMFMRAAPAPVEKPAPPAPPPSDKLARGKWLLDVCSCHDCHDSFDARHMPIPGKPLGGGFKFPLPNGKGTAIASNISSDKTTGIGAYTDEEIHRALEEGKGKNGRLLYVMPWSYYSGLTAEDKDALVFALRQEPAVVNAVPLSEIK